MEDDHSSAGDTPARRPPWNKGKLVGAKPPLRPSHVWSIRTKLQMEGLKRDLALFNLAIDSKLRGCDVVCVRVDDVARPCDDPSEENGKAGAVRINRPDAPGDRRVFEANRPEARPVVVSRSPRPLARDDNPAIRPARRRVGRQHRTRCEQVRHSLVASHEGSTDLSAHRKSAGGPAFARTHED
jgi:hypothetical protein